MRSIMRNIGTAKRFYLMISIIITLPIMYFLYLDTLDLQKLLQSEKQHETLQIAIALEQKIPGSFQEILAEEGVSTGSNAEKVAVLNRRLQPLVEELAAEYPHDSVGIYDKELRRVVAIAPHFSPDLLVELDLRHPLVGNIYETGRFQHFTSRTSLVWEEPVFQLVFPIYRKGELIGHTWANYRLSEITQEYYWRLHQSLARTTAIWFVAFLLIWLGIRQRRQAFGDLAKQIQNRDYYPTEYLRQAELLPVLKTVQELQRSLTQEYQVVQELVSAAPFPIIAIDNSLRVTHINESFLRWYPSLKKSQVLGQPLQDLLRVINIAEQESLLIKALAGETSRSVMIQVENKQIVANVYPLQEPDGGAIFGAVGTFEDVSELEMLRRGMTRMERFNLVGMMAASVAHEIRNPMTVIRGFTQLLMLKTGEQYGGQFTTILGELDRVNQIISDFLALARNRTVDKQRIDLNTIIRSLYPLLQADALCNNVNIELELAEYLPMFPLNDREIKQLLLNLARNGMEAMSQGGTLTISTVEGKGSVRLAVADSGAGIGANDVEKIFDPFYTTKGNGTGLGLPVCLSIVEQHDGYMSVESQQGRGTVFTVTFMLETLAR